MEKKTRLITIDYDEYLELLSIKNNVTREVLIKLKREINRLKTHLKFNKYNEIELVKMLDTIMNSITEQIVMFDKKVGDNDRNKSKRKNAPIK